MTQASMLWHDSYTPELTVAAASTLNRVASGEKDQQLTVAGENTAVRLIYGQTRVGAKILNVLEYGGNIVIQALWGFACDSVVSVTLNDADLPSGATATHYTGSQVAADSTLVAAFAAQSPPITYADTLNGYCYSVFVIAPTSVSGSPSFAAVIKGRKVWNGSIYAYSDNPSKCLYDFLTDTVYGCGKIVDWTSASSAATWNDTDLGGGETHRRIALALDSVQSVAAIVETLRTYAGVWLVNRGGTIYFVQDKAAASSATYAHANGQIKSWSGWTKRDLGNSPTIVEIAYTETSQIPYRERTAVAQLAGVGSALPKRVSRVSLPGIDRYSQAYRESVERLNKLSGNDLSGSITVFDQGVQHEVGDIVTVSLPFGITSKDMRVISPPGNAGPGLWTLDLEEYDATAYSTEIRTAPVYGDTDLPSAAVVPSISIAAAEEVYQAENGLFYSRIRVTITAPMYIWLSHYRVEIVQGTTIIESGTTITTEYVSAALQDSVTYTIHARMISTIGASSAEASTSATTNGKTAIPSDVPSVTGFEVGGDVYLYWQAATDVDIWRYEIRYSSTGGSWETAAFLDRIDGLSSVFKGVVPAGTWKFWVKALDSIGQYSTNAVSVTIAVTLDPDALRTDNSFTSPSLTAMTGFQRTRGATTYYVTDPGAVGDRFGTQFSSNLSTYTNVLATYHTSTASIWQSEAFDFGQQITGDWNTDATWSALSGTGTATLQLSTNGTSYSDYTSLPTKQTARYVKVKLSCGTADTLLVIGGAVRSYVQAVTRKEFGSLSCNSTGTDRVYLTNTYFTRRRITLTPIHTGTSAVSGISAVVDNISVGTGTNSFDVYLFDMANTRIAGTVDWAFEGV